MKRFAVILFAGLSALAAFAQSSAISRSGQFIIHDVEPEMPRPYLPEVFTNSTLVKLEPALLAVSCERIKQTLLGALGVPDQWRGKIHVVLHPARAADEDITVASTRYADAWNYEVSLPDKVKPNRLVHAITQVLLVEMANRPFPPQSAALPTWLAEGMPEYLAAISDIELVVKPASSARGGNVLQQRTESREGRHLSPFAKARERLRERDPLTIKQLSFPDDGQLAGPDGQAYRDTALLFISELLQFKNGGNCLFAMLPELAWDPDWRVGFLKSFRQYFQREIDFEKWWALQSAYFAARDSNQAWPRAESVAKLEEILRTPFEVRLGSNEPALYTDVSLQAIIKGWKLERQTPVLQEKIRLLQDLQLRIAPELKPLARQYHDALVKYLGKLPGTTAPSPTTGGGKHPLAVARPNQSRAPSENDPLVKQTLAQLDLLDARCVSWRYARGQAPTATP